MWPSRRTATQVECIACGSALPRADAREYDKYGDRWDRVDKEFEHFCKPCDRQLCRHRRAGLESLLVEIGAGERSREEFLRAYCRAVDERATDGSIEE